LDRLFFTVSLAEAGVVKNSAESSAIIETSKVRVTGLRIKSANELGDDVGIYLPSNYKEGRNRGHGE